MAPGWLVARAQWDGLKVGERGCRSSEQHVQKFEKRESWGDRPPNPSDARSCNNNLPGLSGSDPGRTVLIWHFDSDPGRVNKRHDYRRDLILSYRQPDKYMIARRAVDGTNDLKFDPQGSRRRDLTFSRYYGRIWQVLHSSSLSRRLPSVGPVFPKQHPGRGEDDFVNGPQRRPSMTESG